MADVCIHTGPHDSSVSIIKDGKLYHFIEERFSHIKHASTAMYAVDHIKEHCDEIENLSFSNLFFQNTDFGCYQAFISEILKINTPLLEGLVHIDHHYLHANTSYRHSGFDDAIVLVIDGAGSQYTFGKENLSVYKASNNNLEPVYKTVIGNGESITEDAPDFVDKKTNIGAGYVYTAVTEWLGFDTLDAGKTMGLSAYGNNDGRISELISIEYCGTKSCKLKDNMYNNDGGIEYVKTSSIGHCGAIINNLPEDNLDTIKGYRDENLIHSVKKTANEFKQNIAYRVQKDYEKYLIHTCKKVLSMSKSKNLILTGGCALNCVANYKLLKSLPVDVNLYVDPTCDDSSVSIGGAYTTYNNQERTLNFKLTDLYKGRSLQYEYELLDGEDEYEVTAKDITKIISKGNIVAIAQGRSEIGPRALGNRSILFDPRVKNGKDIVNRVKKREWFRPFAGTVLLEHSREWFDMNRLEESPFMMYAVDVLPEKRDLIQSIVHVDGTCRIQTVTREQNKHYYDLISEFYKLTGVPILFNTSFNLAGDTMVDTIEDGLWTLRNSEIEYMYLPETSSLIHVPNK
jgi:carbamoyltransferase